MVSSAAVLNETDCGLTNVISICDISAGYELKDDAAISKVRDAIMVIPISTECRPS